MNKKWIKIIDFLNMIHNGEKPPKKIIISGHRYRYNEKTKDYDSDIGFDNKDLFLHIGILKELDTEIAILEDNTEEQESLGESWKEVGKRVGEWAKEFQKGFTESFSDIILSNKKDNTEEIEELEYYCIGQEKSANLTKIIDKIEEIKVAINQIRKDLNNDK